MVNTIVNQIKDGMKNGSISYDELKNYIAILTEIRKEAIKEKKRKSKRRNSNK